MEHLGRAGLRPSTRGGTSSELPLSADAVLSAVESLNASLATLLSSTIHDASGRYRAFAEACEALLELADRATQCGIAGTGPFLPAILGRHLISDFTCFPSLSAACRLRIGYDVFLFLCGGSPVPCSRCLWALVLVFSSGFASAIDDPILRCGDHPLVASSENRFYSGSIVSPDNPDNAIEHALVVTPVVSSEHRLVFILFGDRPHWSMPLGACILDGAFEEGSVLTSTLRDRVLVYRFRHGGSVDVVHVSGRVRSLGALTARP